MSELRLQSVGSQIVLDIANENSAAGSLSCLIVGDPSVTTAVGEVDTFMPGLIYAAFADVTPDFIALVQPDMVLSPVVGDGFDCIEMAGILVTAGFRGRYRAAARVLPDPHLVKREVAAHYPALDFDLVLLDAAHQPAS